MKDGINNYLVNGQADAVNPEHYGTKSAAHYLLEIPPGGSKITQLRLCNWMPPTNGNVFGPAFDIVTLVPASMESKYNGTFTAVLNSLELKNQDDP